MTNFSNYLKSDIFFKLLVLLTIVGGIYLFDNMINLFLMTFVFIYIMNRCVETLLVRVKIPRVIGIILIYIGFIALIALLVIDFLPIILKQTMQITDDVKHLYNTPSDTLFLDYVKTALDSAYSTIFSSSGVTFVTKYITNISKIGFDIFVSLLLSLFFLLGKNSIKEFIYLLKKSKIGRLVNEYAYFGNKFLASFGKVIEVQIIIAIANTVLSTIGLYLIGFPNLVGFSIMILFLGLIPVAGVMISFVPLSLVAYSLGGYAYVIYIILLILIIHGFESYLLNPKLTAHKTKLPPFIVFLVLIVSESLAGVWGLLFGIPLFIFILDILGVPLLNQRAN